MFSPDGQHEILFHERPLMAFDPAQGFEEQQQRMRAKLRELLGETPEAVPLCPEIQSRQEHERFTEYRIVFQAEQAVQACCILCIPKLGREKYPLAVCLQGHSTGMHISMGRRLYPRDNPEAGDRDIAIQALDHGFAALCLEQRGMGERRTGKQPLEPDDGSTLCHITSMNALLLGRTMLGERCFDISRAIDLALTFPEIDGERILCTGNSGGGTASFYAACLDERIGAVMPSCSVCTFRDSIGAMFHCVCNFVPGLARYMDMGDMAAMIAPRKLIVVGGREDPIFPDAGVREAFRTIQEVYRAAGVPENCALATGSGEHRYYRKEAWEAFDRVVRW